MNVPALIGRYPIVCYVAINYAISWAFLYPAYKILLAAHGSFPPLALFGLIGSCGPSIAALIVLAATKGPAGVKAALGKFTLWRAGVGWYLFVLIGPIGIAVAAVFVHARPAADIGAGLLDVPVAFLIALPFGPLGEELGWRGYLLPRLLERHGFLLATLILGSVWTVWHLASFTYPGAAIPSYFSVGPWTVFLYFCSTLAASFLFTYVYLKTRGSVLFAVLLHMAFNASSNIADALFPTLGHAQPLSERIYVTEFLLVAAWALACFLFDRKVMRKASVAPSFSGRTVGSEGDARH